MLANILSTRPSGRLYKALVETQKASSASAFAGREHDPGLFSIDASVPRDGSLEEVRDLLISTTEEVGTKGVTDEEVNRARQQILKARERASTDTAQMGVALSEWAAQGDWRLYFLHRDRIEKVTPEAVKAVAAKYLDEYKHALLKSYHPPPRKSIRGHGGQGTGTPLTWYLLVKALREGREPYFDVYDSVTSSVITALTETSVANRSRPVEFPDFTKGKWKTRKPLEVG